MDGLSLSSPISYESWLTLRLVVRGLSHELIIVPAKSLLSQISRVLADHMTIVSWSLSHALIILPAKSLLSHISPVLANQTISVVASNGSLLTR